MIRSVLVAHFPWHPCCVDKGCPDALVPLACTQYPPLLGGRCLTCVEERCHPLALLHSMGVTCRGSDLRDGLLQSKAHLPFWPIYFMRKEHDLTACGFLQLRKNWNRANDLDELWTKPVSIINFVCVKHRTLLLTFKNKAPSFLKHKLKLHAFQKIKQDIFWTILFYFLCVSV